MIITGNAKAIVADIIITDQWCPKNHEATGAYNNIIKKLLVDLIAEQALIIWLDI